MDITVCEGLTGSAKSIWRTDDSYNMMAELLADNNLTSIKVAVFKGKDKSKFIKRNEYGNTCLIYAME